MSFFAVSFYFLLPFSNVLVKVSCIFIMESDSFCFGGFTKEINPQNIFFVWKEYKTANQQAIFSHSLNWTEAPDDLELVEA